MAIRKTASSLTEFVEWAEQVAEAWTDAGEYVTPWFRGMTSTRHKLVPGLYRSESGRERFADDELRSEFKRRGLPLVAERPPRDDWEWYSLMQHYGAPTRLLDWTDSALVGLYFALSAVRMNVKDFAAMRPAVWALNAWALNQRLGVAGALSPEENSIQDYLPPLFQTQGRVQPQYPIALDPVFIAQRMLVQHSHFTMHGNDVRGLDEMIGELPLESSLFQVVLDADSDGLSYMNQLLARMGVTETTIFPDLGGLARELSVEYGVYW